MSGTIQSGAEMFSSHAVQSYSVQKKADRQDIHQMIKDAQEKVEKHKKSLELPKNSSRYGDTVMLAYSKLSRARNTAEVSSASGYARRQIAQLRSAKRSDPDNAERIQAAINQLQKAVNRAGKKRRDLEQEACSERRRARLEREHQMREAQRTKTELNRCRSMRLIKEHGYIREAEIDNRMQAHMAETRMELREQARQLSESVYASPEMVAQQYTAQTSDIVPAPEINIQV